MAFSRRQLSLDGTWRFIADPEGVFGPDGLPDGVPIAVPSCWEALLGPATPLTTAWYVRSFEIPGEWDPSGAVLRFGAVSDRAEVWLNGLRLGGHEGGYTRFELAAGGAARHGANELVVRVVNPAGAISHYPAFDDAALAALDETAAGAGIREIPIGKQTWYSSLSGIWQSVVVDCRPRVALSDVAAIADAAAKLVKVSWAIDGVDPSSIGGLELRLGVVDGDGIAAGEWGVVDPSASGEASVTIAAPRLWELDDPHLYQLDAELRQGGVVIDRVSLRFGVRDIGTSDGRVTLNGRPRYIRGVLDQDVYDGTIWVPASRDIVERTLRKVKAMGFNLVRCHIKVPDPVYFEVADEIGLLVWAELPSWNRLTEVSGYRARRMLAEMVDQLRHHPSIVIWTIVNEDWGTDLINSRADRTWLRETYDWLKGIDPARLVVDNSACWTHEGGNFHLRTDLADFHLYFAMPEHADRWRAAIEDFAGRPSWLWGPDDEASRDDSAPLILSEFGNWGLPRHAGEWWIETGAGPARPDGGHERFDAQDLTRISTDPAALAEATQWHQLEAMQFEVGDMRRHPAIAGYVVTELSDVFWEANGLINLDRSAKAYDDRLVDIFGGDTIFADLDRWDVWAGDVLRAELHAVLDEPIASGRLSVTWQLAGPGMPSVGGVVDLAMGPDGGRATGTLALTVPLLDSVTRADLTLDLVGADGTRLAQQSYTLVVVARSARQTTISRPIVVSNELAGTTIDDRVASMGHRVDAGGTLITGRVDDDVVAFAERGGHVLAIVNGGPEGGWPWVTVPSSPGDRITGAGLARPVSIQSRYGASDPRTGRRLDLNGDWITAFSWVDPAVFDQLPRQSLLGFAARDVIPDQVLLGADAASFADEVVAGSFAGWIAEPAAYAWRFDQGAGSITITTFRLDSDGPVAWLMLESLIQHAAQGPSDVESGASTGALRRAAIAD